MALGAESGHAAEVEIRVKSRLRTICFSSFSKTTQKSLPPVSSDRCSLLMEMGFVERLVTLAGFSANFISLASASSLRFHVDGQNVSSLHVEIAQGGVQGFRDGHGNAVYLGIPYAASTGGENRYGSRQQSC